MGKDEDIVKDVSCLKAKMENVEKVQDEIKTDVKGQSEKLNTHEKILSTITEILKEIPEQSKEIKSLRSWKDRLFGGLVIANSALFIALVTFIIKYMSSK